MIDPFASDAPVPEGKARDPFCGMVIDKAGAPTAEVGGQTYWFCCEGCRQGFLAQHGLAEAPHPAHHHGPKHAVAAPGACSSLNSLL